MYVYRVVEVREKMVGGRISGQKLQDLPNEHAHRRWRLKAITSTEVKGRIGASDVGGMPVTLERVE